MRWTRTVLLCLAAALPARAEDAPPPTELLAATPDRDGPAAGFDRALLAELGREAGYAIRVVPASAGAALADLDAGRIDIATGPFPPDAARGRPSLPPVLTDGDALLRRRGDGSVGLPSGVAGKRVGPLGPAAEWSRLRARAVALRARAPARAGLFGHDPVEELLAGRLAALVGPLPEVAAAALARPNQIEVVGPLLEPVRRLAPLVRADRPEVAERLAAALRRLRANGALADLQRRWFGLAFDPPEPPQPPPVSTSKP